MPKPLLLQRPSGLYVRFLLPLDVRALYGSRFIVRSLRGLRGDEARWHVACLGYALAQALSLVRKGGSPMDTKKLLDAALAAAAVGSRYEVSLPGGYAIKADGAEDHARALEALRRLGKVVIPGLPGVALAPAPVAPRGPTLHEAIERFLGQFGQKNRATATATETVHSLTLFRDLTDDVPLNEVGNAQIDRFRWCIEHWPARARVKPEYRGLNPREIVAKASKGSGVEYVSTRTFDKHLDRLRVFFSEARQRKEIQLNPLEGVRLQTAADKYLEARRGFTAHELTRIFDPRLRSAYCMADPQCFWIPVLMLFTGARMNEVVYLDVADLDEVDGVPGLHLTKAKGGKMKTPSSVRYVPLAKAVLDLGLRQYATDMKAAGFVQLFPGGVESAKNGRGDKISKWFNRTYLRKACGILDTDVCLQAFRNTFISKADRAGVSEAQLNPLVGHGPRTLKQRHYIDPSSLRERCANIKKLTKDFKLPKLARYRSGQFEDYLGACKLSERRAGAEVDKAARHAREE